MVYAVKNKLIFTEGSAQRHNLLTNIEKTCYAVKKYMYRIFTTTANFLKNIIKKRVMLLNKLIFKEGSTQSKFTWKHIEKTC